MTDLQYDQLYSIVDADKNGKVTPDEIPGLVNAYEGWLYEKSALTAMEDLYSDSPANNVEEQINVKAQNEWVRRWLIIMSGPRYELVMNIASVINVTIVFIRSLMSNETASFIRVYCWV